MVMLAMVSGIEARVIWTEPFRMAFISDSCIWIRLPSHSRSAVRSSTNSWLYSNNVCELIGIRGEFSYSILCRQRWRLLADALELKRRAFAADPLGLPHPARQRRQLRHRLAHPFARRPQHRIHR